MDGICLQKFEFTLVVWRVAITRLLTTTNEIILKNNDGGCGCVVCVCLLVKQKVKVVQFAQRLSGETESACCRAKQTRKHHSLSILKASDGLYSDGFTMNCVHSIHACGDSFTPTRAKAVVSSSISFSAVNELHSFYNNTYKYMIHTSTCIRSCTRKRGNLRDFSPKRDGSPI